MVPGQRENSTLLCERREAWGCTTTGALRPLSSAGLQQDVSQCTLGLWGKPGREQTLQSRPRLVSRSAAAQILGLFETSENISGELSRNKIGFVWGKTSEV